MSLSSGRTGYSIPELQDDEDMKDSIRQDVAGNKDIDETEIFPF